MVSKPTCSWGDKRYVYSCMQLLRACELTRSELCSIPRPQPVAPALGVPSPLGHLQAQVAHLTREIGRGASSEVAVKRLHEVQLCKCRLLLWATATRILSQKRQPICSLLSSTEYARTPTNDAPDPTCFVLRIPLCSKSPVHLTQLQDHATVERLLCNSTHPVTAGWSSTKHHQHFKRPASARTMRPSLLA